MPNQRTREGRDRAEILNLRRDNHGFRGQVQTLCSDKQELQSQLNRVGAWAEHYKAESEQKDSTINELIEQKKQTDELNEQKDSKINELKQKIEQLERKNVELEMAAVNINK